MSHQWRRAALALTLLALLAFPSFALAQDEEGTGGAVFRVNGSARVGPDEAVDTVMVINGDATVEGTVRQTVMVVNGNGTVSGWVNGDLTVINGTLSLQPTAHVNNVSLVNGELVRDPGATVTGTINDTARTVTEWPAWPFRLFSVAGWLVVTLLTMLAGVAFVAIGPRLLTDAGRTITTHPGETALAAVIVAIAVPALAALLAVTVFGIPIALALVAAGLVVGLMGYLATATRIGEAILQAARATDTSYRLYIAMVIGVAILRLAGLVPFVGGLIGLLANLAGVGALAYLGWRAWQARSAARTPGAGGAAPAA